ncbi:MAG: erythromycin biosynthesis sensory transduction protein eryC1 [Candidatus Cloacimonadota bacterium]|nr:MAG: erythromycin biosynthesis sensory transduction protein eryC1 [Candidatus Cloacimonadota bacterium]
MKIPFVDLKCDLKEIKLKYLQRVEEILDNTSFVEGKYNKKFEDRFSKLHDCTNCITLSSGTAGNHLALQSLGVGIGDEVILPVNTFIASAWGITLCGATPIFIDVKPDTFNINPNLIEEKITSKTKAIVVVHLFGLPAEMDKIKKIANKYDIAIVEDAAQAHLAEFKGKKVGSFGDVSSFSFYPSKNLGAFGEGGAITSNNSNLSNKIRRIKNQGSESKYIHSEFGNNYRMSHLIAASLDLRLDYLEKWTNSRINLAKLYSDRLINLKGLEIQKYSSDFKHVYHLFVIQIEKRDLLQDFLNKKGISTGIHYPIPLHLQVPFKNHLFLSKHFSVANKLANRTLSLPMYPNLKVEEVTYICDCIEEFLTKNL